MMTAAYRGGCRACQSLTWSMECQDKKHLFVRLGATSSSRPQVLSDGRAQIKSRPACWAAAKRLGLDLIEHAIRLSWSGISGPVLQQADSN